MFSYFAQLLKSKSSNDLSITLEANTVVSSKPAFTILNDPPPSKKQSSEITIKKSFKPIYRPPGNSLQEKKPIEESPFSPFKVWGQN